MSQHRIPSTGQHQIRISSRCEAPTQTHKSHHQTHEAPTSFQWNFSPNKEGNVVPMTIPTCPTPRVHENTYPKIKKSTLPLREKSILTTLYSHLEVSMSPILGITLSPTLYPLPKLLSNPPDLIPPLSPKKTHCLE